MKTWELVKDFQLKFPNLVKDLITNSHHWDDENLNPYHIEAPSTWAHCMMVCLMAEHYRESLVIRIAALGHDLAKPFCTTKAADKKRIRMFGHESVSVFFALDYLKTLDLSNEDKVRICQLICFHTYLYQAMREEGYETEVAQFFAGEQGLFTDLVSLTRADALGRFQENENREIWENAHETFAPVLHKINPVIYPRVSKTEGEAIILVGPPMSGKSTWLKKNAPNHLVVCRDQVILDLAKTQNYNEAYHIMDEDKVNQEFDLRKKEALKSGKNIVFDLTHMTEKSRRKSMAGIPKNMKRRAVVFLVGYETLKARNEVRAKEENKRIPDYVLQNMMGNLSMPMRSEGFDEISYVFEE